MCRRMIQAQVMRLEASCMLIQGLNFNELLVNCEAETDLCNDDDNEIEEDDGQVKLFPHALASVIVQKKQTLHHRSPV